MCKEIKIYKSLKAAQKALTKVVNEGINASLSVTKYKSAISGKVEKSICLYIHDKGVYNANI